MANRLLHVGITPEDVGHINISRAELQPHCPETLLKLKNPEKPVIVSTTNIEEERESSKETEGNAQCIKN